MLEQQEGQQIQQAEPQGQPPVKKGGAHVARSGKGLFAKKKAAKEEKTDPQKAPEEKQPKEKKKLSRKARIAIGAGAGAVVLAAGITAGVLAYQAAVRAEQANTSVACYGTIETFFEGSGVTAARVREELGLDIRGTVTDVLVEPGDEVQAGDDLILIGPEHAVYCAGAPEPAEYHSAVFRQDDSGGGRQRARRPAAGAGRDRRLYDR